MANSTRGKRNGGKEGEETGRRRKGTEKKKETEQGRKERKKRILFSSLLLVSTTIRDSNYHFISPQDKTNINWLGKKRKKKLEKFGRKQFTFFFHFFLFLPA